MRLRLGRGGDLKRAYRPHILFGRLHARNPDREIHPEAPGPASLDGEARAAKRVQPLCACVIANMGMVAQQFDRLQMRIEERLAGSINVDERRSPAALQRAPRFPKASVEVAPVMRGESAGDEVEHLVLKRETLGWRLYGLDVAQPLLERRPRDRRQHLGGQISSYDPSRMARERIGDMAPARAEIERQFGVLRERSDRLEIGPLTVNRAFDIGFRPRAELRLDDSLMGLAHNQLLSVRGLLRFDLHCYKIELYPITTAAMLEADQRRLLGEFVRAHRERVRPKAATGRRRTSGLRREELAALAGISVTWCTWIEQGRAVQASPDALGRISQALSLSRAEHDYLFKLAGRLDPEGSRGPSADAPPSLIAAVNAIEYPAYGLDRLWNACCWNDAAARLFRGWLDGNCQRNLLRYMFLEPSARELIPNWEDRARRLLAEFRADFARTFRDAQVKIFVETLRGESAFFAEAWDEQAVQIREGGLRVFNHPRDGLVSFIQHTFAPAERPDYKLVINTPAGR
jgi:transcriptional regulator with XRE-family HTH domain